MGRVNHAPRASPYGIMRGWPALGATAVGIGRPYGWGITLAGAAGAQHVLQCLLAEADLTMGLNGYRSVSDLAPEMLVRVG